MAKPNYSFEKRQREIAKKKKKEEKILRKLAKGDAPADETDPSASDASAPADAGETAGNS